MKHVVYFSIAIRLILLFSVAIFMSFIPEHLRDFFGDTLVPVNEQFGLDPEYNWGARHYWYFWLMVLLFVLPIVNLGLSIKNILEKHYDL